MEPADDPSHHGSGHGCLAHVEVHKRKGKIAVKTQQSGRSCDASSLLLLPAPSSFIPVKYLQRLWWSRDTVAVVTGGNKGLGLRLVSELAKKGLTVVLTARDTFKGLNAFYELRDAGIESVAFHPLDVCSSQSVEAFAAWLNQQFGGLDILINNAGLHCYSEKYEDAVETFETNYYGVKRVIKTLLPLFRASPAGARVVNVSSQAASLQHFENSCLREKVGNLDVLSESMLDDIVNEYLENLKAGKWIEKDVEKGEEWAVKNNFQYIESKLLLNTYTQILARSLAFKQPQHHRIFVNAICPGCIQTDMAAFVVRKATELGYDLLHDVFGGCTIQSLEEGTNTTLWLTLLPRAGYPNGKFFAGTREISF